MTDMTELEYLETETGENPVGCVIWMHGLGADASDFEPIVPMLPLNQPLRFVFPNAPIRPITVNGGAEMRGWYDIDPSSSVVGGDDINESAAAIKALVENEIANGFKVQPNRLGGVLSGRRYCPRTWFIYRSQNGRHHGVIYLRARPPAPY